MTIDEVYNLTKETMKNWKVTPTYSVGVVEATYGYPSNSQFLVEIDVPSKNVVGATTHVFIGSDFSYSTENEFYSLDELKEYLEMLDKLNDEDFLNAREEMGVALSSYFKELFQCEV